MKNIIIIICAVCYLQMNAQDAQNTNFCNEEKEAINIFEHIDFSKIETGILYETTIPFVNMQQYNGTDSIGVATLSEWRQMYLELKNISIYSSGFISLDDMFKKAHRNYLDKEMIPIGILNYEYNYIREDAGEKGLMFWKDGQLHENPAAKESPYAKNRAFAVSPFKKELNLGENEFVLSEDFYFTNNPSEIDYIEIDFDDGLGFQSYSFGQYMVVDYSTSGIKQISLKIVFSDGKVLDARTQTKTEECEAPEPDIKEMIIDATIPYNGYYNTNNVNDLGTPYGQAKVSIWYASGNNYLTKPFLMLDGFDVNPNKSRMLTPRYF